MGVLHFGTNSKDMKSKIKMLRCGLVLQVYEKKPLKIKNFGVWLRYNSRSGTHNMYREYRDMTAAKAVTACCKHPHTHSIVVVVGLLPCCKDSYMPVQDVKEGTASSCALSTGSFAWC